jgi:uncharacterized delta-60 repeat protein
MKTIINAFAKTTTTLTIVAAVFFTTIAAAQPGALDGDFDGDGKLVISIPGNNNASANAVTVQPDGKIVAAGYIIDTANIGGAAIWRFFPDGSPDPSFGNGGKVTTAFGGTQDAANDVILQPDGKILITGYTKSQSNQILDFFVGRYLPNGSLDTSFSFDGKVITDMNQGDNATDILLQPDGKILIAGTTWPSNQAMAVLRYNTDGSLDNTFGTNGKLSFNFGNSTEGYALALQPDGKILVGGAAISGPGFVFALARLNPDGSFDTSFSFDGKVTTNFSSNTDVIFSLHVLSNGNILASGYSYDGFKTDMAVACYLPDGTLNTAFGSNGKVLVGATAEDGAVRSMVVQPDGKILLAGNASVNVNYDFAVVRLTAAGTRDSTFGNNGVVTTPIGNSTDLCFGVAMQPDGKILLAGQSYGYNFSQLQSMVIVRYLSGLNLGIAHFKRNAQVLVYPNPISNRANLEYELTQNETLTLQLFDMKGTLLNTYFTDKEHTAGRHTETIFLSNGLSSGQYILQLTAPAGNISVQLTVN